MGINLGALAHGLSFVGGMTGRATQIRDEERLSAANIKNQLELFEQMIPLQIQKEELLSPIMAERARSQAEATYPYQAG